MHFPSESHFSELLKRKLVVVDKFVATPRPYCVSHVKSIVMSMSKERKRVKELSKVKAKGTNTHISIANSPLSLALAIHKCVH